MNAESYLRKQGWKGSGHSLDTTGRGIKKPLLIAHKQDQLGLGKKKAAWTTDDQWWMRAYDQSLQTIGSGQDSTLNQIRTKGINRGGLYGFFVKGEAIAGTIEDSSASATDASIPPSGASTPPTSDSESEAPTKSVKITDKKTKRKRQDEVEPKEAKKAKKTNTTSDKKQKAAPKTPSSSDQAEVNRKIAKFSPKKREWYEKRAAAKNQTLNDYILRRVQKKSIKRAKRRTKSVPPAPFFTDLEGDATLISQATTAAADATVLGIPQQPLPETESTLPDVSEPAEAETPQKPVQKKVHGNKSGEKKRYKAAMRAKQQLKKEEKKAVKAEKRANKCSSKFGQNKDRSWYNKNKAKKKGVVTEGETA